MRCTSFLGESPAVSSPSSISATSMAGLQSTFVDPKVLIAITSYRCCDTDIKTRNLGLSSRVTDGQTSTPPPFTKMIGGCPVSLSAQTSVLIE
ncbi:hypothetical protein NPIL_196961 [Nephila pilipes]|uniref:Uncharacterized protein n=1 Tax=Nephila pilipes TaxID=299642 RepID=A0A8X6PJA8_NEPPI|nr:hypothetical protein NPIL_196961 [Nephila pilipes]